MDITKMTSTELMAELWKIDQQAKKLQMDYQEVGKQLEKKIEEEEKTKKKK